MYFIANLSLSLSFSLYICNIMISVNKKYQIKARNAVATLFCVGVF